MSEYSKTRQELIEENAVLKERIRNLEAGSDSVKEHWQNTFDALPDLISLIDSDHRIMRVNRAMAARLKCSPEEAVGRFCYEIVHGLSSPPDFCPHAKTMSSGTIEKTEVFEGRLDGHFDVTTTPLYNAEGNATGSLHTAHDITDRKHGEEALRASEEENRRLFETMAQGVIYQDADGAIISANPAAERILGLSFDQMCGKTSMDPRWKMIREDGSPVSGAEHPAMVALRTGQAVGPVARGVFHPEKNTHVWLSITAIPLFQPGETVPFQAYATFEDITERKKAEAALLESEKRFQRMLGVVPDMISIHSPDMDILYSNWQGFAAVPENKRISNTKCYKTYRDLDAVCPDCRAKTVLETRESFHEEALLPDGTWVDLRVIPILDKDNNVEMFIEWVRDISDWKRAEIELVDQKVRFESLFTNTSDAIVFIDSEHKILNINEQFARSFGYHPDEIKGHNINKVVDPRGMDAKNYASSRILAGEKIEMEAVRYRKNGDAINVLIKSAPVVIEGRVAGGYVIYTDITERKQAEKVLQEERVRLEHILSITGTGIDIVDGDFNLHFVDKGWQKVYGDPSGRKCYEYFNGLSEPCPGCGIPKALETKEVVVTEEVLSRENNRVVEVHIIPFMDATGKWLVAEFNVDITERKKAEDKIEKQQLRLENIIKGTNAATWGWNVQTGEHTIDERWAEIVGYTLEELEPVSIDTWENMVHQDDIAYVTELLDLHFHGNLPRFSCEYRMKHKNGQWAWVQDRGQVISYTADGKPLMMYGTLVDITERKQSEEEREKLQVQLTQAQKMESVGRLAGGVAHDFNNMLGIILGHTDMALEYLDPDQPVHSDLTEIRKATMRSADLVRQLLAFARKQTIATKVLDLNDTVEGMLKMLRRLIGEDIDLSWMPGKNLWPVNMDPTQIDQILANLCVNARDAIDGVGKVTIETDNVTLDEDYCSHHAGSVPGDYALLAVSDDGTGIKKEILDKIYDPFFTTKEVGKGTGLGLPMIYGIVKQNEGYINVYSEPGEGTTFRIYIPRHIGEVEKEQRQVLDETIRGGDETILLVEDEPMLLQMGKDMLDKLGYRVLTAGSPAEAFRIAAEHKEGINLLITDVIMPQMNGRDLADQLSVSYPNMKVIFMSGYTANVIAHHGVLDPGVKFVQKPFSMKDLANRIREALEG